MSATSIEQVFSADGLELRFSTHYPQKQFLADAARIRTLARKRTREPLSTDELAELPELRRRLRRADADTVLLAIIEARLRGGYNFF
jgi:hypothetical protein